MKLPARALAAPLLSALAALVAPGCAFFNRAVKVDHPRVELPSGVAYQEVIEGLGPAATPDDEVTFDYTAWLEDGTRLDSTHDRGVPVTCVVREAPLPGWREGLVGMRAGGSRRLWLPPAAAYGEAGVPGLVPPGATLAFLIEMLEVHAAALDAGEEGAPPEEAADEAGVAPADPGSP